MSFICKENTFTMQSVNIVFLVFPKTHLLDLAGSVQVFYEANQFGNLRFKLHFVSSSKSIKTEQGLMFSGLIKMEDIELRERDMICVPGIDFKSFVNKEMDEPISNTKDWMKEQYKKGVYISSICSGALILAKMGILKGVKCTTHWKCLPYAKKNFPNAQFLNKGLYVFDKGIFTSAGMTTGIDMCLALIESWISPLLAANIAQEMVISVRRAETQNQQNTFLDFKNHFNADVYKAQQILANRFESSFTIKDLANELNIGERQLARLFKSHTKQTIQAYRDKLRFEYGKQLLYNSELSVKEIAYKCGFESTRQFDRIWKNKERLTPLQSRSKFNKDI